MKLGEADQGANWEWKYVTRMVDDDIVPPDDDMLVDRRWRFEVLLKHMKYYPNGAVRALEEKIDALERIFEGQKEVTQYNGRQGWVKR